MNQERSTEFCLSKKIFLAIQYYSRHKINPDQLIKMKIYIYNFEKINMQKTNTTHDEGSQTRDYFIRMMSVVLKIK